MEQLLEKQVGSIVASDYRTAAVFEKYGIDFCCNGGKPLGIACSEKQLDPTRVTTELLGLEKETKSQDFRPAEWDLDALADHIVNTHHTYVRQSLPIIQAHLEKVIAVHGKNHSELAGIGQRFEAIAGELTQHMRKEELVLFPHIKNLATAERSGSALRPPPFGSIRNPIRMMENEHQSAGEGFAFIRSASNDLTPPEDACTTYRVLYRELADFERDLHQHIHLENNILFPRSIGLEGRVVR